MCVNAVILGGLWKTTHRVMGMSRALGMQIYASDLRLVGGLFRDSSTFAYISPQVLLKIIQEYYGKITIYLKKFDYLSLLK